MEVLSMGKYGATRVSHAGYSFASKLESALFDLLSEREGVTELQCQASVYLTDARILYKPDFQFLENGVIRYAEAKGMETNSWRIKRRLWMFYGPAPLEIWKGSYQKLRLEETICPK
jgi:hypothetical protein